MLKFFSCEASLLERRREQHHRYIRSCSVTSSQRTSCRQTKQWCGVVAAVLVVVVVDVMFGRPGSRLVQSDLESELGAVGVLPP